MTNGQDSLDLLEHKKLDDATRLVWERCYPERTPYANLDDATKYEWRELVLNAASAVIEVHDL